MIVYALMLCCAMPRCVYERGKWNAMLFTGKGGLGELMQCTNGTFGCVVFKNKSFPITTFDGCFFGVVCLASNLWRMAGQLGLVYYYI